MPDNSIENFADLAAEVDTLRTNTEASFVEVNQSLTTVHTDDVANSSLGSFSYAHGYLLMGKLCHYECSFYANNTIPNGSVIVTLPASRRTHYAIPINGRDATTGASVRLRLDSNGIVCDESLTGGHVIEICFDFITS